MMSKKTFLIAISLFAIVAMIPSVNLATAHNPQLVEAWYERNTWQNSTNYPGAQDYFEDDTIFVIITHDVTDEEVHFVDEIHIEITRDDGATTVLDYTFHFHEQENIGMNEYHFLASDYWILPIETGDVIHVTAYSNDPYLGSFSTHMVVGIPFDQHETSITEGFLPSIIITILISIPLVIIALKDSSKQKRAIKSALVNA